MRIERKKRAPDKGGNRAPHTQKGINKRSLSVQFIGQAAQMTGTSAEAKERAVAAFHERLVVLERQLGRIQEDLQLG